MNNKEIKKMKAKIKAPYSKYYGWPGEVVSIQLSPSILGDDIAKVKVNGFVHPYRVDELELSEDDKETILRERRWAFLKGLTQ
jgi:hypothetical protein